LASGTLVAARRQRQCHEPVRPWWVLCMARRSSRLRRGPGTAGCPGRAASLGGWPTALASFATGRSRGFAGDRRNCIDEDGCICSAIAGPVLCDPMRPGITDRTVSARNARRGRLGRVHMRMAGDRKHCRAHRQRPRSREVVGRALAPSGRHACGGMRVDSCVRVGSELPATVPRRVLEIPRFGVPPKARAGMAAGRVRRIARGPSQGTGCLRQAPQERRGTFSWRLLLRH
jgi:hypothetical protein